MTCAVAICTRNRPNYIWRCLDSLKKSQLDIDELIIVEDIAEQQVVSLPKLRFLFGKKMRLYYKVIKNKNIAISRNKALDTVTSEVLFFFDDDVRVPSNFLSKTVEFYKKNKLATACVVRVEPDKKTIYSDFQSMYYHQKMFGEKKITLIDTFPFTAVSLRTPFIFKRGLRFDESLDSGEDIDFLLRCTKLGGKVFFNPTLFVHHYFVTNFFELVAKIFFYSKNMVYLHNKHGPRYYLRFMPSSLVKDVVLFPYRCFKAIREAIHYFQAIIPLAPATVFLIGVTELVQILSIYYHYHFRKKHL